MTTKAVSPSQIDYLTALIARTTENLRHVSMTDRIKAYTDSIDRAAIHAELKTLATRAGMTVRELPESVRGEVRAYHVNTILDRVDAAAAMTDDSIIALNSTEASALIDLIKAHPW